MHAPLRRAPSSPVVGQVSKDSHWIILHPRFQTGPHRRLRHVLVKAKYYARP